MTTEGYKLKQAELDNMIKNTRPAKIAAVAKAKALGDLSENAEYQEARREQSILEGRILALEDLLARAETVDTSKFATDVVKFGAFVTIENQESDIKSTYRIVGDAEADIKDKKISTSSPIGRALINKRVGDLIQVALPAGEKLYKILKVSYK